MDSIILWLKCLFHINIMKTLTYAFSWFIYVFAFNWLGYQGYTLILWEKAPNFFLQQLFIVSQATLLDIPSFPDALKLHICLYTHIALFPGFCSVSWTYPSFVVSAPHNLNFCGFVVYIIFLMSWQCKSLIILLSSKK